MLGVSGSQNSYKFDNAEKVRREGTKCGVAFRFAARRNSEWWKILSKPYMCDKIRRIPYIFLHTYSLGFETGVSEAISYV